jgi:hypothetical protein
MAKSTFDWYLKWIEKEEATTIEEIETIILRMATAKDWRKWVHTRWIFRGRNFMDGTYRLGNIQTEENESSQVPRKAVLSEGSFPHFREVLEPSNKIR